MSPQSMSITQMLQPKETTLEQEYNGKGTTVTTL